MLTGREKTSGSDRNPGHEGPHRAKIAERDKTPPLISLPHKGAIFRYDPPVFD
jgi:hypothetical protein